MKVFLRKLNRRKALIIMVLPVIVYYILFNYLPMFGAIIAFKDFKYSKGFLGSEWVGFKNFEFLFQSSDAWVITRNTIVYNVVFIALGMFLSMCLAIIFDMLGKKNILNRANQTLVLFPHFISWVVATYFVSAFLSTDKGILNQLIVSLGGSEIDWYSKPQYWPFILTVCYMWKHIGYNSIVYYSTIKGFDVEFYEAARVDGATWFQQIRYITIPLLKSMAIIMLILNIGSIFYSDFGLFYLIPRNSGALYSVTSTIDTYVYNGFIGGGNIGTSAATGLYQSVVGFVLVLVANGIVRKVSPEQAMF